LISARELVSAQPPPLFSSPAAAHLLPPGMAQSAIATLVRFLNLSVFSTTELVRFSCLSLTRGPTLSVSPGSSSELAHFRYLSVFSTSKLVRSGRFARRPPRTRSAQLALSAQSTARRWRPARLPPPIRKSVNFRNRLLLLLPPTIATRPRSLPASRRRARGASFSRCETPSFLHYTAVVIPPSTQALTSFNGLNRHSPPPPLLRPFNHPSPSPEPLSQPL
jgi:hypothetical protein